jgi:hypothetical protein
MGSVQEAFVAEAVGFERVPILVVDGIQGLARIAGFVEGPVVTIQVIGVGHRA